MRDTMPSSTPVYYNELEEMFAPRNSRPQPHNNNRLQRFLDEELDRWMNDPIEPSRNLNNNKPESVVSFWERMEREGNYRLLPKVVKVLFAIPMSSCQIERDFSVSGSMVTTQRTSLSQHNIDMCSFLNNRDFIDLLQCEAIPCGQHRQHIPSCFTLRLDADPDIYMDMDSIMDDMTTHFVSSATLYEEQKEEV
ncbi:unnamed protein product [Phytophthora fragariaefolia]|uniref:Unnamed protein product n=1 Tax=Phytophthora fragariaefolia TaxID=1490495 RepID=A0A9W6TKL1_9STRA|nr:unnamed protein product [Phytophthora fragariaefolia]